MVHLILFKDYYDYKNYTHSTHLGLLQIPKDPTSKFISEPIKAFTVS